jgi:hypothetical protein
MKPALPFLCALVAAAGLAVPPMRERPRPLVAWFAPAPGSLDMLHLFEAGDEWAAARSRVSVFKFYQQHLQDPAPPLVGPNTYNALRAIDAFRTITHTWHKQVAIEVGAVKEQFCTADASGMNASIRATLNAVAAVHQAGGEVTFLAMDEPFLSGRSAACGGPDAGPTLRRLDRYFANVRFAAPGIRIGLIEAYPSFSARTLAGFLAAMSDRGIPPAFFHLDVDLNALDAQNAFGPDARALADACAALGIPFGVIVWGHSGDSDRLYVDDAMRLVERVNDAFPESLPQLVFQSWAQSRTGLHITPTNLPERTTNTHTWLIDSALHVLSR